MAKSIVHLLHHELTGVAGAVQLLGIGGADGRVVPRDVTEALHLLEIEERAEETGQSLVLGTHGRILAMVQVLQEGVDVAQGAPAPAAAAGRNGPLSHFLVGKVVLGVMVVVGDVNVPAGREIPVKDDGERLQFTLALEESVSGKPVLRNGVQQVVAAGESKPGKHYQNGKQYLFHGRIH